MTTLPDFDRWGHVVFVKVEAYIDTDPVYAEEQIATAIKHGYEQGVAIGKRQQEEEHTRQSIRNSSKRYEL